MVKRRASTIALMTRSTAPGFRRSSHNLINPRTASCVFGAFAKLGKSQHDPADDCPFVRAEIPKSFFGRLCNCAFDPAALAITVECQRMIAPAFPQLE